MYTFEIFHYLCEPEVVGFPKLFLFLPHQNIWRESELSKKKKNVVGVLGL